MQEHGGVVRRQRRSQAEVVRLVEEFERSGLGRKAFSAAHGLNVHTLDAWRQRVGHLGGAEKTVPVELVDDYEGRRVAVPECISAPSRKAGHGRMRVVLLSGLRVDIEAGFDAAELWRLVAALDATVTAGPQLSAV